MKKISTLIAVSIGLTTIVGTAFTVDSRYSKTEDVKEILVYVESVDKRLDLKILKDRADALQTRIWAIQDKFGYDIEKYPDEIRDQYRDYKKEFDEIMEKIKGK